jgi:hypothetical protein
MDRVFGESCLSFFQKRLRTRSSLFAIAATGLVAAFSIIDSMVRLYEISLSATIHEPGADPGEHPGTGIQALSDLGDRQRLAKDLKIRSGRLYKFESGEETPATQRPRPH